MKELGMCTSIQITFQASARNTSVEYLAYKMQFTSIIRKTLIVKSEMSHLSTL